MNGRSNGLVSDFNELEASRLAEDICNLIISRTHTGLSRSSDSEAASELFARERQNAARMDKAGNSGVACSPHGRPRNIYRVGGSVIHDSSGTAAATEIAAAHRRSTRRAIQAWK